MLKSLIIGISLIICLFFNYHKNRTLFNVSGIFTLFWGICAFFSSLGLYGLDSLSYTLIFLIVAAMFVFNIVGFFSVRFNKSRLQFDVDDRILSNNKLLVLINIIAQIYSIPYLIKAIGIIRLSGLEGLRLYAFVGSSQFASTTTLTIFQSIIQPVFIATMILTAIDISLRRKAIIGIVQTIIGVAFYTVLFGGRYMVFQLLVVFLMAFYTTSEFSLLKFLSKNKKLVLFGAAVFMTLVLITSMRPSGSFIQSLYIYFCGSFKFLDVQINNGALPELHLYGAATFGLIYDFFVTLFAVIFKTSPYIGASYQITQITSAQQTIGDGIRYNALGTMYTSFIADFGVYGSIIGVIIFAIILHKLQTNFTKKQEPFRFALFLYGIYMVFNTAFSYSLLNMGTLIVILFLYAFTRNIKLKVRRK